MSARSPLWGFCRPGPTGLRGCARPGNPVSRLRGRRWAAFLDDPVRSATAGTVATRPSPASHACRRACATASCRRGRCGAAGPLLCRDRLVYQGTGLARVLLSPIVSLPRHGRTAAPPRVRSLPLGRGARSVPRLGAWPDRIPAGRRRDARALAHGLHAQPSADDHGVVLAKDLLVPWRKGAAWFWDTLCGADLANNSASWQWVVGCGTDAHPPFASSIPRAKRPSSIPRAPTSAAGCLSSDVCHQSYPHRTRPRAMLSRRPV